MIEQVYRVPDLKEASTATLQKALEHIHASAAGVTYPKDVPTLKNVPMGQVAIFDDGTTIRLCVRTGLDNVGCVTMTKITA
jgi:hypothetical protein